MSFVPDSFTPPLEWHGEHFQLQVLAPRYVEQDLAAVRASAGDIRYVFGPANGWPDADMEYAENLADLARHEVEFQQRKAFAYAMLDPCGERYLGCVYIRPIKSRLDGDLRKTRFQAQLFFWLSSLQSDIDAQQVLQALQPWLAACWPFAAVAYPGREIDWPSWERMARDPMHHG
ncbi:hypothetical protein QWZ03_17015 [Chitinimonas viridis]|uniref:GNAT family N-acetyltransferase n=1 Tax=Chitinimonas viridis TaxID=664880 RepID=A0ABT8BA80_9NEIS|nr:hypothetical protein [Chitinimonas viridis]MDN3578473.1 hypothetical protein [Chitinimonas viridis]